MLPSSFLKVKGIFKTKFELIKHVISFSTYKINIEFFAHQQIDY